MNLHGISLLFFQECTFRFNHDFLNQDNNAEED